MSRAQVTADARLEAATLIQAIIDEGEYEVSDSVRQVVEQALTEDLLMRAFTTRTQHTRPPLSAESKLLH